MSIPISPLKKLQSPSTCPEMRNKAHFIAISTTSGTATEVTSFSVITDNETGIKYPIADYNITPDVAILDTTLVEKMPQKLVANTGMDALTHALEAYVSTVANPFYRCTLLLCSLMPVPPLITEILQSADIPHNLPSVPYEFQCLPYVRRPVQ